MKSVSKFSIACFLLSAAALTLAFLNTGLSSWIPAVVGLLAWFAGVAAVKVVTLPADMASSLVGLVTLGITLDSIEKSNPWFLVAMLLIGSVYSIRPTFIKQMGYMKMSWWEPVSFVFAIAGYVYVNLTVKAGWPGWALPGPVLFFAAFSTMGGISDVREYKKAAKKEYGVQEGKAAPSFSLPDNEGKIVVLGEFRNKQLVLLLFVRGDWCPSCHIMLRTYEKHAEKFREKNVVVMAIGPDPVGVNKEMVRKLNLEYRILADEHQEALKAYGVQYQENNYGTKYETGIPMPASILVDKSGTVQYISRADRAGEFLNPLRIFSVLETLEA